MKDIIKPEVLAFFDKGTNTFTYIVIDPTTNEGAIIDSVLDFDYASGNISYVGADQIIACVRKRKIKIKYLIETHVHADHLSAAPYLQNIVGGKIGISEKIHTIQETFGKLFNEGTEFERDGSQFDILFTDGQSYEIGNLNCQAIHTPGHTPACMAHVIGDAVFVGDTLFMPDAGTARADFPGGDARTLYQSIQKILSLPDSTRMFICHDYRPNDRELAFQTTVEAQKNENIHIRKGISERDFVVMREARDKTLAMPKLIYPSLQINMRAGHFPPTENNNTVYLKVPITGLEPSQIKTDTKSIQPHSKTKLLKSL